VVERLVDRAPREMNLDPAAVRRRNFVPNDAYPYTTHVARTYDLTAPLFSGWALRSPERRTALSCECR
jgi:CO/xanthine dehydrogenase Mo-binding subunit